MNQLQVTARSKIHEGKLSAFTELAAQCMSATKEKDQHTLQYDWFINKEKTECVVRERCVDSNAILVPVANPGDLFGKILQVSDFSVEVYGEPSQELINATTALNLKIYSFYQGL
ncbi:MAG: putative quinol monooxygenase [Chitinophagaceae bacterium]